MGIAYKNNAQVYEHNGLTPGTVSYTYTITKLQEQQKVYFCVSIVCIYSV